MFSDDNSRVYVYSSLYHPRSPGGTGPREGVNVLVLGSDRDHATYEIAARRVLDSRANTLL